MEEESDEVIVLELLYAFWTCYLWWTLDQLLDKPLLSLVIWETSILFFRCRSSGGYGAIGTLIRGLLMELPIRCLKLVTIALILLVLPFLVGRARTQGLPQSPYGAPSMVRGGLDLPPSNPLGMPTGFGQRGADSIYFSDRMFRDILPLIPNLQVGYLHSFGKSVRSERLTLDYLQPVNLTADSTLFGEAHTEFHDFWKTLTGSAKHRVDLSLGGGYRRIFRKHTLMGINGFYDTTRLGGVWYSSGSLGLELAALLPGNDAVDLRFNWYGNLFNSDVLADAFRKGPQNYDLQAAYSHELWERGPDLRLSATGYRFSSSSGIYGCRGAAELKTRDGMFSVKYEAAHDRVNKTYHTVGGFVNVGLRLTKSPELGESIRHARTDFQESKEPTEVVDR